MNYMVISYIFRFSRQTCHRLLYSIYFSCISRQLYALLDIRFKSDFTINSILTMEYVIAVDLLDYFTSTQSPN